MAIGRTFEESLKKRCAARNGKDGLTPITTDRGCDRSRSGRTRARAHLLRGRRHAHRHIERRNSPALEDRPGPRKRIRGLVETEAMIDGHALDELDREDFFALKSEGFSDKRIAALTGAAEAEVRAKRLAMGVRPFISASMRARPNSKRGRRTCTRLTSAAWPTKPCRATRRRIVVLGGRPEPHRAGD